MPDVTVFMTFLVTHAALDRGAGAEHVVDRGPECLGAVDHDQHALLDVEAAVHEVRQKLDRDGLVLGRALPQPERDLHAVGGDSQRDHARVVLQPDPIDHQHRQPDVLQPA